MKRSVLSESIRAICMMSLGAAALPLHAAEDTATLDTITVEGDRINVIPTEPLDSVFGFGKTVVETPRSVTTISNEMLEKVMITELDDLVAMTPGAFTQSFFGVAGSLDVRGTPGENYFRGMKRIENPGNYPTPIGASDHIDVVRGPASPIYGPSKIGGYLNFVPKSARATTGQYLTEAQGELGVTAGNWDKKVMHAEVGGPGELFGKPLGFYLYSEFENSGSYYDNTGTDQSIFQASFDLNISETTRLEFGGMYQDYEGNQVAGWNRVSQDLIDNGTYVTGSPVSLDTDGDGLMSNAEATAGNIGAFVYGPSTASAADIEAELVEHPNMALVNPGTTHIDGSTVLVQDDDTLEDQVLTLYLDTIIDASEMLQITNKTFYESLDNLNENAYGFSQMANTWAFEDQLIFGFTLPRSGLFTVNLQLSPSIRYQDFEHGDDYDYEYFDRRDITQPGSPVDRRTMATRGQDPYTSHTKGNFTDYALAAMADITLMDKLNLIAGARYDYIDMEAELLPDTSTGASPLVSDADEAMSWSASLSYQLPFGLRPYVTKAKQSTLILGQGGQIPYESLEGGNAVGDSELTEVGMKASLLDNRLFLAVDYYEQERIDYNAQDTVTNNTTEAKGYEFEARWVITPRVTVTAAYTNIKVYNAGDQHAAQNGEGYPYATAGAADLQGVDPSLAYGGVVGSLVVKDPYDDEAWRKAGVPENVYSLYGLFSFEGVLNGLTGSLGATHVDAVASGFSGTVTLPAYTLVNASIYYETGQWKIGVQGKNLTDERYFRSNFPDLFGSSVVLPELPRNYLMSASYKF